MTHPLLVLGIDPGLANTGYALVRQAGDRCEPLLHGQLNMATWKLKAMEEQWLSLFASLQPLVQGGAFEGERWPVPHALAIERFHGRGVPISGVTERMSGLVGCLAALGMVPPYPVVELYAPSAWHQDLCGASAVDCEVKRWVHQQLNAHILTYPVKALPGYHNIDALGIACTLLDQLRSTGAMQRRLA